DIAQGLGGLGLARLLLGLLDTCLGGAWLSHEREMEGRALAKPAFNRDIAAHETRELAGDRKAKTCAAEPARDRGIRLGEGAEQPRQRLLVHANAGVGHRDAHAPVAAARRFGADAYVDAAMLGELDGVGEEVADALPHANRVVAEPLWQ